LGHIRDARTQQIWRLRLSATVEILYASAAVQRQVSAVELRFNVPLHMHNIGRFAGRSRIISGRTSSSVSNVAYSVSSCNNAQQTLTKTTQHSSTCVVRTEADKYSTRYEW